MKRRQDREPRVAESALRPAEASSSTVFLEAPTVMKWCAMCLAALDMPQHEALLIAQTLTRECHLQRGSSALDRLLHDLEDMRVGRLHSSARPECVAEASNRFWIHSQECQEVLTLRAGIELATVAAVSQGWAMAEMSANRHTAAIRVFLDSRAREGMAGLALIPPQGDNEYSTVALAFPLPNSRAWLADLPVLNFMSPNKSLPCSDYLPTLGEIAQQVFEESASALQGRHDRKTVVLSLYLRTIAAAAAGDLVDRFAALVDPYAAPFMSEDGRYCKGMLRISEDFLERASIWSSRLGVPLLRTKPFARNAPEISLKS